MAVKRLIGVDFGTSTSVIRVQRYEDGKPIGEVKEVTYNDLGSMVPTLVLRKNGEETADHVYNFGFGARQGGKDFTKFHSFKMDLESSDPEKRDLAKRLTEKFYVYLAEQYRHQSEDGHLGEATDKEHTIVSYPVKWSEETKSFMLDSAKKAGFPNVTGMDEARAAIQAVVVRRSDRLQRQQLIQNGVGANILLIDMGAGTTDLVLARYTHSENPELEVLNTWPKSGDIQFGGREIDDLLQKFFRELMPPEEAGFVFRVVGVDKFKSWKEQTLSPQLGDNQKVDEFAEFDTLVDYRYSYCLDRTAFEDCMSDYLKQFPKLVNDCLQDANMSGSDVDLVIVTGGHSQWYFVKEMLSGKMTRFGEVKLPKIQKNPERIISVSRGQETVALGLAYSGIHVNLTARTGGGTEEKVKKATYIAGNTDAIVQIPDATNDPVDLTDRPVRKVTIPDSELVSVNTMEDLVICFVKHYPENEWKQFSKVMRTNDKQENWFGNGELQTRFSAHGISIKNQEESRAYTWKEFMDASFGVDEKTFLVRSDSENKSCEFSLINGAVQAYDFYTALQAFLREYTGVSSEKPGSAPETTTIPPPVTPPKPSAQTYQNYQTNVSGGSNHGGGLFSAIGQTLKDLLQQEEQYVDPRTAPYAPDSEFELLNIGEDYVIKKYLGKRDLVSIPPTIRGRRVVAIGPRAFSGATVFHGNKALRALVIPETICSIGDAAFWGCTNLHTVLAHRRMEEIGGGAFSACNRIQTLDFGMGTLPPGHVKFPPSMKKIGPGAFYDNVTFSSTYLKEVHLSRQTKVKNPLGGKTFDPKCCAVFYYD